MIIKERPKERAFIQKLMDFFNLSLETIWEYRLDMGFYMRRDTRKQLKIMMAEKGHPGSLLIKDYYPKSESLLSREQIDKFIEYCD